MREHLRLTREKNNEEYWNILTHGLGVILSFIGIFYLLSNTKLDDTDFKLTSILLFGFSSIVVYITSTLYHYNWNSPYRSIFRTADHISIFFLIAGSYSPFLLITFTEETGWRLFIIIWLMAFVGSIFKFFFTGKYEIFSLAFYVAMGWTVLIEFKEFMDTTPELTFYLLIAGGAMYCIGVFFYRLDNMKYNHAIWHVLVCCANFLHFYAVATIL